MFARALVSCVLAVAIGFIPARGEEEMLLPMPTKAPHLVPPAVTTTATSSTTLSASKSESCASECPERVCAPAQRIKVIVPPPEIVFRYAEPPCKPGQRGHKGGGYAAPAACAPAGGEMKFNMNFNGNGGMTAMVPMIAGAGFGGFGGMGLPFGGPPMMGSGFGAGPFGVAGAGSTGIEALLMRALAGQSSSSAEVEMEARIRRLDALVNTRIEEEMNKMRAEVKQDLSDLMVIIRDIRTRLAEKK